MRLVNCPPLDGSADLPEAQATRRLLKTLERNLAARVPFPRVWEELIPTRMENTMTQRLRDASLILLAAASSMMMPAAKADQLDKLTTVTFSEPVEIPGRVLLAGTYVFKLLDSQSERIVVQVFSEDQKQLIATILAVPDYRLEATSATALTFEERTSGSPEALHSWFYPGDNYGLRFVYGKTEQQYAERSESDAPAVQTAAAAPIPEPEPAPLPAATAGPLAAALGSDEILIVDRAVVTPEEAGLALPSIPDRLPQTAGNFAAIPLFGILLLAGGLTAVRFAARQN